MQQSVFNRYNQVLTAVVSSLHSHQFVVKELCELRPQREIRADQELFSALRVQILERQSWNEKETGQNFNYAMANYKQIHLQRRV